MTTATASPTCLTAPRASGQCSGVRTSTPGGTQAIGSGAAGGTSPPRSTAWPPRCSRRAAAEVALQRGAALLLARVGVAVEQVGGGHDHARRAVAALEAVVGPEGLLHRMQRVLAAEPLDRGDLRAVGLDGEHGAALHRP